jgi:hypothetical protein
MLRAGKGFKLPRTLRYVALIATGVSWLAVTPECLRHFRCRRAGNCNCLRSNCEHSCWGRLVRGTGLEPARPCGHWLLRPARLPVPPAPLGISQWYHLASAARRPELAGQSARNGSILFLEIALLQTRDLRGYGSSDLSWLADTKNILYQERETESLIASKILRGPSCRT